MKNLVIGIVRVVVGLLAWSLVLTGAVMLLIGAVSLRMIPSYRRKYSRTLSAMERYVGKIDIDGEEN
jgi:membrane protein YdbS with pleckstrin-like domain